MTNERYENADVSRLVAAAGLADLPESFLNDFKEALVDRLEMRVGDRISELLDAEQLEELEKLFEGDDDEAARTYISNHLPGYREDVVDRILQRMILELWLSATLIRKSASEERA